MTNEMILLLSEPRVIVIESLITLYVFLVLDADAKKMNLIQHSCLRLLFNGTVTLSIGSWIVSSRMVLEESEPSIERR
jgi:hypothetical protein